jgi:hypothetical protein
MPWGKTRRPHRCGLKGRENPTRQESSRGPSGRNGVAYLPPRASAFGLRCPGLRSPGPLGRTGPDVLGLRSGELVQLLCDEP